MRQFGRLFMRSFPRAGTTLAFQSKPPAMRVGLATLGLSLATWFTTNKFFNEELQII